ncbi:hypothetical protein V502_11188 [Pseudogymnoascus sp. VKM F-4520 (FW-2644)]|nr:hypothetical protein V502_11188 [Pseudogymnoascus sp. VKM F-4520 (FW-2644)]
MPSQHLPRLDQTPLILSPYLADGHQEVLLPRLLIVSRALALGVLLRLPDACVDLCSSRPGLPSRASTILLDALAQERQQLNNLCRERLVGVPGEKLLLALGSTAHRLVDINFGKNVL